MFRLALPIVACAALGACADLSRPGRTPTAYDGTYEGTVPNIHVAANSCGQEAQKDSSLTVQNGSVVWASAGGTMYAPIARDGSFAAQFTTTGANAAVFFNGKITRNAMVARSSTGACHQIYDLVRKA